MWQVLHGDCRDLLDGVSVTHAEPFHYVEYLELPEGGFDAVVTDPPYGIEFMGGVNDWDHEVPGPEYWEKILKVCKPGAYLVAFGGTRTFHRLYCAIEDAGWEIRDTIGELAPLLWIHGQGFPKSLSVSKAVLKTTDKAQNMRRIYMKQWNVELPLEGPAKQWEGFGTQLKPSFEPIVLARKPLDGTVVRNVLKHGCGAINVDGCRIDAKGETWERKPGTVQPSESIGTFKTGVRSVVQNSGGRWPANLTLTHHPDCVRRGTKKVKACGIGSAKGQTAKDQEGQSGAAYGAESRETGTPMICYADSPDGTETVENWECHAGGTFTVPVYIVSCAGGSVSLSVQDEPERLLDRLQVLIQAVREYSKVYSNLLPHVSESVHSVYKRWEACEGGLADAIAYDLGLSLLPGSLGGCQSYPHFCDGLFRQIVEAAQASPQQLADVLESVCLDLQQLLHSQMNRGSAHQSNSDGSDQTSLSSHSVKNKSVAIGHSEYEDEKSCYRLDTFGQTACEDLPNSILLSSSDESGRREKLFGKSDMSAVVRLLCLVSADLAYQYILPASTIQRQEIIINDAPCPVRMLDEQKSGVAVNRNRSNSKSKNIYGDFDKMNEVGDLGYGDAGGASRFFYCAKASRTEREAGLHGRDKTDEDARRRMNKHSTVKPLDLVRWLVRMVTPPGGVVLDPFGGSGTTGVAARMEGVDSVVIDREWQWVDTSRKRVAQAAIEVGEATVKEAKEVGGTVQLGLFSKG
jgi:site-specific DNA-methyltransferase (adenine-specific)